MVIHAAGILGVGVGVDGGSTIFLWEEFLDLPSVWLDADRELKIFLGDRIPKLQSS